MLDHTHAPAAASWVDGARGHPDFPIQNLPMGIFSRHGEAARVGVAIGDQVLDARTAVGLGLMDGLDPASREALAAGTLKQWMALPPAARTALRHAVFALLDAGHPERARHASLAGQLLHPLAQCELHLPADVGDYTDFYAGIHHARQVGKLFRPDNPLMPNYKHVPIAYHGRASSIRVSGTPVRRPTGQVRTAAGVDVPALRPSAQLDFELELAIWIGPGNALGEPVPLAAASGHAAGYGLLNDWSARDIQAWEYQPLGPFQGKNFASTVSPWVVTADALAPFRCAPMARGGDDPELLPYLRDEGDAASGGLSIALEAWLSTARMRELGLAPRRLAASDACHLYWTPAQMVAQHTLGGCNLRPGDLLGSGTISAPDESGHGSLLELTRGGTRPIELPSGETRLFLEAGDEILLTAHCQRDGFPRIGFGESRARIID
ncbi:fumarylacetoacetase [Achromobacter denitrificans]